MSDSAVADTAGPSTANGVEIEQELKDAELQFQQGVQAIKVRGTSAWAHDLSCVSCW